MEVNAKITLSALEQQLIMNPEWIHAKNAVMNKWAEAFSRLSDGFRSHPAWLKLPEEVRTTTPKLSKGEQYKGLPYLVLDYPRYFEEEHMFAIRTFFWWGHFFSSTLQLKGKFLTHFSLSGLTTSLLQSNDRVWMRNCSDQPWIHDFGEEKHWCKLEEETGLIAHNELVKVGVSLPVQEWEKAETFLKENFNALLETLVSQTVK